MLRSLGADGRATMLEMPQFGVSSSAVRERAAGGPAAALPGAGAGRPLHRGKGDLRVSAIAVGGPGTAPRRARRLEKSRGHRRPRHARPRLLHRLPGHLHGPQRAPGEGDRRRGAGCGEARDRACCPSGTRRRGRSGLDRSSTTSTASSTSSPRRRATATSSRTSGARRRAWSSISTRPKRPRPRAPEPRAAGSRRSCDEMPSEGPLRCRAWEASSGSLFGYRRPDVDAAISARDATRSATSSARPSSAAAGRAIDELERETRLALGDGDRARARDPRPDRAPARGQRVPRPQHRLARRGHRAARGDRRPRPAARRPGSG